MMHNHNNPNYPICTTPETSTRDVSKVMGHEWRPGGPEQWLFMPHVHPCGSCVGLPPRRCIN